MKEMSKKFSVVLFEVLQLHVNHLASYIFCSNILMSIIHIISESDLLRSRVKSILHSKNLYKYRVIWKLCLKCSVFAKIIAVDGLCLLCF